MMRTATDREIMVRFRCLLLVINTHVAGTQDVRRAWSEVSLALGLPCTQGQTETAVANEFNVSRQCISKGVTTFYG
jgi:hypothetical protein